MGFVLVFGLGYLALCGAVAFVLARALRSVAPRFRIGWTVVVLMLMSIALTPIPIHGGFVLLLPELISEGWRELRRERERTEVVETAAHLDARFTGFLPAANAGTGERDEESGLVWTDRMGAVSDIGPQSLEHGRQVCAAVEPRGYWAVPRSSEYYFLARAGRLEGAWLAETFVMPGEIGIASVARGTSTRAGSTGTGSGGIGVRCVAVTPPAPRRGYLVSDIPLDEWNRYQLGLLNPGRVAQ